MAEHQAMGLALGSIRIHRGLETAGLPPPRRCALIKTKTILEAKETGHTLESAVAAAASAQEL